MSNGSMLISTATRRNWLKLDTQGAERLTRRANKTCSEKLVAPDNYACGEGLDALAAQLISSTSPDADIFYGLCLQKLSVLGKNARVDRFISEYGREVSLDITVPAGLLADPKRDWLGYLYQMRTPEGQRNLRGQYYTHSGIVGDMLSGTALGHEKTLLDPCCGTGAFLMNAGAASLSQLYGVDIDEVAVMIAKANLMVLFPDDATYPQIYCEDYLEDSLFSAGRLASARFDYIYTNPPWGICKTRQYFSDEISSGERSSLFFVKAFGQLKAGGQMGFLMPSSLLKVKVHQDFRSFVLKNARIREISLYNERFNGVFTDFFSVSVIREAVESQAYSVRKGGSATFVTQPVVEGRTEIELNAPEVQEILTMVDARRYDTLGNSIWALGIVTGDNKRKLKKVRESGAEAIYTGKDIGRYRLKEPTNFIHYDRTRLQQCAKDEYYRCPEKLVYKFISKSLCFAYDDSSGLFLNSANILIPNVRGMSIKTVLAFLNSELFSYYYSKKFTDLKVLKGNLMTLPFPKITAQQDAEIAEMVSRVLNGEESLADKINDYVYALYGCPSATVNKVKKELYGGTTRTT